MLMSILWAGVNRRRDPLGRTLGTLGYLLDLFPPFDVPIFVAINSAACGCSWRGCAGGADVRVWVGGKE